MNAQSQTPASVEVVTTDLDQTILAKFNALAIVAQARIATEDYERTRALPGLDSLPDLEGDNAKAMTDFLVEMGKSAVEFFRANPNGDFLAFRGWAKGKKQWSIKIEGMFGRGSHTKVETVLMARLPEFFQQFKTDKAALHEFDRAAAEADYNAALNDILINIQSDSEAVLMPQKPLNFEAPLAEQAGSVTAFFMNAGILMIEFFEKNPEGSGSEFLAWTAKKKDPTSRNIALAHGEQYGTPVGGFIAETLPDFFREIHALRAELGNGDAAKEEGGIMGKVTGWITGRFEKLGEMSTAGKILTVALAAGVIWLAREVFFKGTGGNLLFDGFLGKFLGIGGVGLMGAALIKAMNGGMDSMLEFFQKHGGEQLEKFMEQDWVPQWVKEMYERFRGEDGEVSVGAGVENWAEWGVEGLLGGLNTAREKVKGFLASMGLGSLDILPTDQEATEYMESPEWRAFVRKHAGKIAMSPALLVAGYFLWRWGAIGLGAKLASRTGSLVLAPLRMFGFAGKVLVGTAILTGVLYAVGGVNKAEAKALAQDIEGEHKGDDFFAGALESLGGWAEGAVNVVMNEGLTTAQAGALVASLHQLGPLSGESEAIRQGILADIASSIDSGNGAEADIHAIADLAEVMGLEPQNLRQDTSGAWYFTLGNVDFGPLPRNPFASITERLSENAEAILDYLRDAKNDILTFFEGEKALLTSLGIWDETNEEIDALFEQATDSAKIEEAAAKLKEILGDGADIAQKEPLQFAATAAGMVILGTMLTKKTTGVAFRLLPWMLLGAAAVGGAAALFVLNDQEKKGLKLLARDFSGDVLGKYIMAPFAKMRSTFQVDIAESMGLAGFFEGARIAGISIPDVYPGAPEASAMLASLQELRQKDLGEDVATMIDTIEAGLRKDSPRFDSREFRHLAFRAQKEDARIIVEGEAAPYSLIIASPVGTSEWEVRFDGLLQHPMPKAERSEEQIQQEIDAVSEDAITKTLAYMKLMAASNAKQSIDNTEVLKIITLLEQAQAAVQQGGHQAFTPEMQEQMFEACEAAGISCEINGPGIRINDQAEIMVAGMNTDRWEHGAKNTFDHGWLESLADGTYATATEALSDSLGALAMMTNLLPQESKLREIVMKVRANPSLLDSAEMWLAIFDVLPEDDGSWFLEIGELGISIVVGETAFLFSGVTQGALALKDAVLGFSMVGLRAAGVESDYYQDYHFDTFLHDMGGAIVVVGAGRLAGGVAGLTTGIIFGAGMGVYGKFTGNAAGKAKIGFKAGRKVGAFPAKVIWEGAKSVVVFPSATGAVLERLRGLPSHIQAHIPILRSKNAYMRAYISLMREEERLSGDIRSRMPGVAARKRAINRSIESLADMFNSSPFGAKGGDDLRNKLNTEAKAWEEARLQQLQQEREAAAQKQREAARESDRRQAEKYLRRLDKKIAERKATLALLETSRPSVAEGSAWEKFRRFFSSPTPPGFVPASQAGFVGPVPETNTANPPEGHADADANQQRGGAFGEEQTPGQKPASQSAADPEPRPDDAPDAEEPKPSQRPEVEESNVRSGVNPKTGLPSDWEAWTPPSASEVRSRIDGVEAYKSKPINNQTDASAGRTPDTGLEQPSSAGNTPPIFEKISAPEPTNTDPDIRTAPPKSDNPPLAVRNQQSIDTSGPLTDEQIREIYGKGSSSVSIPGTPAPEAPAALVHEPEQQPRLTPQQKVDAEAERIIQEKELNAQQASHLRRAARGLLHVMGPASVVLFLHEVSNAKDPREVFALDAVTFASGTAVSVGLAMTGLGLPVSIPAGIVTSLGVAFFGYDPIAKFFEERRARAGEQERGRQYQQDSQSMQNIVRIAPIEKLASSVFAGETALAHFGETHLQRVGHMNGWGQFQVQEGIDASTLAHGLADTSGKAEIFTREASAETIAQWNKEIRQQIAEAEAKAAKLPRQLQHLANKQLSRAELYAKAKEHNIPLPAWGGPTGQSADAHPQFITIYNAYLAAREAVELQAEIIDEQNEAFAKKYADQIIKLSMQVARWEEDNQAKRRPEFFHAAGELIQAMRTLERIGMWTAVAKHIDTQYPQGTAQKMRDYARKLFAERRKYLQDMDRDLSSGLEADGA